MSNKEKTQSGSITLFAAVVLLPILFFFLTLSVDITELYTNRATMQRLIDEAALYGYRYLPYQEQAKEALEGYLGDLNASGGTYQSIVSSDSIEVIFHGNAPFTFAGFLGKKAGLPYELRSRVRGTTIHAALIVDSSAALSPENENQLWGEPGKWPTAQLFTHFTPFGSSISPRFITQQCFNPVFSELKRTALRLFDYLSSFQKNSIAVGFSPGTTDWIDVLKDARRPGQDLSEPSTQYFNMANGPYSQNGFCLAALEEESPTSAYQLPPLINGGYEAQPLSPLTDPESHLVYEESLTQISLRSMIWSRAIRPHVSSSRMMFSALSTLLASGGELNPFEKHNALAEKPVKVGIILSSSLPTEGNSLFPDSIVKDALTLEISRFTAMLGMQESGVIEEEQETMRKGVIYYIILETPNNLDKIQSIDSLQEFFNSIIQSQHAEKYLSIRVVKSSSAEGLAQGVVRGIVLENNTAVVDG